VHRCTLCPAQAAADEHRWYRPIPLCSKIHSDRDAEKESSLPGRQPAANSYAETLGDFYPAYACSHVRAQKTTIRGFIRQSPYRCQSQVDEPISTDMSARGKVSEA
jgi:hypothetical protein